MFLSLQSSLIQIHNPQNIRYVNSSDSSNHWLLQIFYKIQVNLIASRKSNVLYSTNGHVFKLPQFGATTTFHFFLMFSVFDKQKLSKLKFWSSVFHCIVRDKNIGGNQRIRCQRNVFNQYMIQNRAISAKPIKLSTSGLRYLIMVQNIALIIVTSAWNQIMKGILSLT